MSKDTWRGHQIRKERGHYIYTDTGQLVSEYPNRECGFCGLENTPEGHDGCLGTLPNVMNACCGHGNGEAYIQFNGGKRITLW